MKNLKKTFVFSFVVLLGFSSFIANAEEIMSEELAVPVKISEETVVKKLDDTPVELAICDHNGDGVRNLSDVGIFAQCADTFDANGDGIHDLSDVGEYAVNKFNNDGWCTTTFKCVPEKELAQPLVVTPAPVLGGSGTIKIQPILDICDLNEDHTRNLSDVGIFAQCADTFDVNGDGIHDLSDIGEYAVNNQDDKWCNANFVCDAAENLPVQESESVDCDALFKNITIANGISSALNSGNYNAEFDLYADGVINLSDVGMLAQLLPSPDLNSDGLVNLSDVGLYASQCPAVDSINVVEEPAPILGGSSNYYNKPKPKIKSIFKSRVLGVKESACQDNEDGDISGQTEWSDGTLLRTCDSKVYVIENQQKRHIKSLSELFNYIGQRIYNVKNSVLELF